MKHLALALGFFLSMTTLGHAQSNSGPAELPPPGFEGREFTDSQGCVFLRSTFGGQVTWIPRYGPDRLPVCDASPTEFAASAPVAEPEPAPVVAAPVAPVAAAPVAAAPPATAPAPRRPAPARAAAPQRPRLPRADASGRHPNCPASAPYGQLVDTALGRPLVRCVTSPSLFIDEYFDSSAPAQVAPRATPSRQASAPAARSGRSVQVGSFAVPSNATRLRARLQNAGLPARISQSRGFSVVTVGPFASADSAHAALSSVRHMGFRDAFLR